MARYAREAGGLLTKISFLHVRTYSTHAASPLPLGQLSPPTLPFFSIFIYFHLIIFIERLLVERRLRGGRFATAEPRAHAVR